MAMNWMSSSRFLRRALARSSLIEMPGVSSMNNLAAAVSMAARWIRCKSPLFGV